MLYFIFITEIQIFRSKKGQQLWPHTQIFLCFLLSQDDFLLVIKSNKGGKKTKQTQNTSCSFGFLSTPDEQCDFLEREHHLCAHRYRNILTFEYLKGVYGIAVQPGFLYVLSHRNVPEGDVSLIIVKIFVSVEILALVGPSAPIHRSC